MTHGRALLLVVGAALAFFLPLAVRGEVILADDVSRTATLAGPAEEGAPRPFRDQSSAYVPELAHQLSTRRDRWISTWNPHVELGRPAWQVSGLSKAFVLTHALSWFVRDPYVLYTYLVVLAAVLSVFFGYRLLESLGLRPEACAFGALVLGLGFYVTFWLTYVLYLWGVCWTLALLWMGPRFLERPSWGGGVFVTFSVHALLLTAYPQQIVWHAYLIAVVLLATLARTRSARPALLMLGALAAGALSAAPVYLDLALAAERSARPEVDTEFFAAVLPVLERPADLAALAVSVFDATWFGRPHASDHPLELRGVSWTPAVCVLLPFALAGWRRSWPWIAFAAATVLFACVRPLHAFGVEYLGLWLSRHAPMAAAHVPAAVLAAFGAERVLSGEARLAELAAAALVVVGALVLAGLAGLRLDGVAVGLGLGLAALTMAFARTRSRALVIALGLFTVVAYGARAWLARPLADTRVESSFVESLRGATEDGSRYVWIGAAHPGSLHPNQEVLFDLRSVHSNNSLSSRAYHDWMRRVWSVRPLMEGRLFARLPEGTRPDPQALSFAGISTVVSGSGTLAAAEQPPILQAQFARFQEREPGRVALPRGQLRAQPVERAREVDDALTFALRPAPRETLLFVSQQHHAGWSATTADGRALETLVVNDFYQGVRVPPGVERVELRFRAWVHWSWVPQAAFAAAALLLIAGLRGSAARGPRRP